MIQTHSLANFILMIVIVAKVNAGSQSAHHFAVLQRQEEFNASSAIKRILFSVKELLALGNQGSYVIRVAPIELIGENDELSKLPG